MLNVMVDGLGMNYFIAAAAMFWKASELSSLLLPSSIF
jgi:hypothetical protein